MDADNTPAPRPRRKLVAAVLAAAGLALAIPVSGAFAGSDDSSGTSAAGSSDAPAFVQDRQRGDDRDGTRKGDCPKDRGGDRGGENGGTSGPGFDESREL